MEERNNAFAEDTMDLDGIRSLLNEEHSAKETPTEDTEIQEEQQTADNKDDKESSFSGEVYSLLHDIIYILAIVTIVFVFIVRLVGVDGQSMLPTLHNNDYVLLESNFLYRSDRVKNGDIVVLSVPYYAEQGPIVKRVIATEGQTVDIDFEQGIVYVDGVALKDEYTYCPTNLNWDSPYAMEYPATVPENCIFVLGDNRNGSTDSRFAPVGMIDESCILGKVFLVLLPGQTRDTDGSILSPRDWSRIGAVS